MGGTTEGRFRAAERALAVRDRELRLIDVNIGVEEQVGGRLRFRILLGITGGGGEQAQRNEAFIHVGSGKDSGKDGKVQEKSWESGTEASPWSMTHRQRPEHRQGFRAGIFTIQTAIGNVARRQADAP